MDKECILFLRGKVFSKNFYAVFRLEFTDETWVPKTL